MPLTAKSRRQNPRIPFACKFVAHNDQRLFHAWMVDLSISGFSFTATGQLLPVGSRFLLHMKSGYGLSPFNVRCEIVARRSFMAKQRPQAISIRYHVRFIDLPQKNVKEIEKLVQYSRRNSA